MCLASQSTPQVSPEEGIKFELKDVKPSRAGALLSSGQAVIGLCLQRYYQRACVQPTPADLEMLINKLDRGGKQ